MNTFELRDSGTFLELPIYAQHLILDALNKPEADYISIQLHEINNSDGSWIDLYGVYFKTAQEVRDYDHNGGLWMYYRTNSMKSVLGLKGE